LRHRGCKRTDGVHAKLHHLQNRANGRPSYECTVLWILHRTGRGIMDDMKQRYTRLSAKATAAVRLRQKA
jgi:hypothetical protein